MCTMAIRIKKCRLENNLTQEELAEKLGLKKSAIAKYEHGRVENIKRSTIEEMARIFECTPSYLMGWEQVDANFSGKEAPKEIYDKLRNNVSKFHGDSKELLDIYQKLSSPNQKKVLTYSKNLLTNQQMEEDLTVQAAHSRTDIEVTDEMNQHDDDIMDDENF